MKLRRFSTAGSRSGPRREFFVVDRQDEGAGAALLLRELRQVAVARDAQHLEALAFDGLRQRANAQARGVFGAEVFVDDDDGKAEFHERGSGQAVGRGNKTRREVYGIQMKNSVRLPQDIPAMAATISVGASTPTQASA
jgi:hypothetical protein